MRNNVVSPRFEEEFYKGQDVVHEGVRVPLLNRSADELFTKLSRRAQRIINGREDVEFELTVNPDLIVLRSMWFDPEDKDFPDTIEGHMGITARIDGKIVGGALWAVEGKVLFLHQLIAGEEGKAAQVPTLLIWDSIRRFAGKGWHSLDIGVSYNPKRYEFFCNFAVEKYPIILKKPFYVPVIRLAPFRSIVDDREDRSVGRAQTFEGNATFFPRGSYALYGALKHIGIGEGDTVMIVKTFEGDFLSGCVTSTIEKTGAKWGLRSSAGSTFDGIKAVLAVHEFGVPVYRDVDMGILNMARERGIPIIEDCAWMPTRVFDFSQYGVFSFQKMFNINYGGMLEGARIDDATLWSWGCLDVVKREKWLWHPTEDGIGTKVRADHWMYLDSLVRASGLLPDQQYDYERAILAGEWAPTVYMLDVLDDWNAQAIIERLEEFGIQAGRYWGTTMIYLPIHQHMTRAEVRYMFAVIRGHFNLCKDYGGK